MTLTTRVLIALLLGLVLGLALDALAPPSWQEVAAAIEPIGTLWTRALQMTVIPLVVPLLFSGVVSGGGGLSRLGLKGVGLFLATLVSVAIVTLLVAPTFFNLIPVSAEASEALRAATATPPATVPGFRDWLVGLIPANLIAAAGSGAMLPLIVATLIFAAGASRLPAPQRDLLERGARTLADLTLIVVRGILVVAPIGVFALALPLALRLGLAAITAVAGYIAITVAMCLATILGLYLLVAVRVGSVRAFARAVLPAQGIAVSARSSLASLPALIDGAAVLGLPRPIVSFFLPFAVSLYRLSVAVVMPAGVLFIARLYGVTLDGPQLVTVGLTSVLLSFSVPGIPGGAILTIAPVLLSVGLPVEGVGILLGVDTIPDMVRTTLNVTGSMAVATVLGPSAVDGAGPETPGDLPPVGTPPDSP